MMIRTGKIISTSFIYAFFTFFCGFAGAFISSMIFYGGCGILKVEQSPERDNIGNTIIQTTGFGASGLVGLMGVYQICLYATCAITTPTVKVLSSRIGWESRSRSYTSGNTEVREHWNAPVTFLVLEGYGGQFKVEGAYQLKDGHDRVQMRFFTSGNNIFDYDLLRIIQH